jgi:(p)ppGpp synthase/HD superfamily hydrolase
MFILSRDFYPIIIFAKKKFKDLRDGAGGLIFEHNLRVAFWIEFFLRQQKVLIKKKEKEMIIAAAMHDIVEDTETDLVFIEKKFGKNVALWINELTISFENKTLEEAVKPLFDYSDEAILIKMFDVYDNVKKSPYFIEKNHPRWLENFWLPLLSEYKKIFSLKIHTIKNYIPVAKVIYRTVVLEIDFFVNFYYLLNKKN